MVRSVRPCENAPDTLNKIYNAVSYSLSGKTASDAIAAQGMTLALRPPDAVAAWLPGEVTKWAAVIKAAGVVVE